MDKRETEKAIEALLRDYELGTGTIVTGVYVLATEVTQMDGKVTLRRIQLDTTPAPGDGWGG